jgi:hypothetical protein
MPCSRRRLSLQRVVDVDDEAHVFDALLDALERRALAPAVGGAWERVQASVHALALGAAAARGRHDASLEALLGATTDLDRGVPASNEAGEHLADVWERGFAAIAEAAGMRAKPYAPAAAMFIRRATRLATTTTTAAAANACTLDDDEHERAMPAVLQSFALNAHRRLGV